MVRIIDPGQCDVTAPDPILYTNRDKYKFKPVGQQRMITPGNSGRAGMNRYGPIWQRELPDPMVIHAAITCGKGGFGAENVVNRYESNKIKQVGLGNTMDTLVVVGSITEVFGDLVSFANNGYVKCYCFDERLLGGILPGNIWLQGKHIPKPGGWQDSRL